MSNCIHDAWRIRTGLNDCIVHTILMNNVDSSHVPNTIMGKGDKRSRKGKIFKGSYGKPRPRKQKKKKK